MGGEIAVTERGFETPRTAGAIELIPRIARIDGGGGVIRGGRVWWIAMVAGRIFEAFLSMRDRMDQRDQGGDSDE